jgi:hypothetical protein
VKEACLSLSNSAELPSDTVKSLQLQMVAAKKDFKAILARARQGLPEGDSLLSKLSINGPCTNELCLCPICECGVTCRCNVADVKDEETCDKCVDFRAKKKAAAASKLAQDVCTQPSSG